MKRKRFFKVAILIVPLILFSLWSYARPLTVQGTVSDNTGASIPGATIMVKGTTQGTISNFDGAYSLAGVSSDGVLVFSFVGMRTAEVPVDGQSTINIVMEPDISDLGEVVVVGYGVQRREAVTGSVASIGGSELRDIPATNFTNALQGRLPGIQMSQNSTRPGASMQIRIRGVRSLTATNDPLIVLDGIPFVGSINEINVNDIKSIDILKDASATAIYGSRGANGVILITTNKGEKGQKAKVTYNGRHSVNTLYSKFPMMDGPEFIALREARGQYTNGVDEDNNVNTDWQDLFFRNGHQASHDIGLSGGTSTGSYSFGIGYLQDQGVIPTNQYSRYSIRSSIDQEIGKYVSVGFNSNSNYNFTEGNQIGLYGVLSMSPILNPYNEDGSLKRVVKMPLDDYFVITRDVVEGLKDEWLQHRRGYATYNTAYGEVKIPGVEGLKFRTTLGLNMTQVNNGSYRAQGVGSSNPDTESQASISNYHTYHWIIDNLLSYDRMFAEKHRVNAVALYSAEQSTSFNSGATAKGIPSEAFQYYSLSNSLGEMQVTNPSGGGYFQSGLVSYMGRVMYEFDDKYMLSVTVRSDASSRLAEGHKRHTYPAVSAGWNISSEPFMKSISAIDRLKIRAGYGQTSNQAVQPFRTLGRLSSRDYNFGETYATGYYVTELPNPSLGWEFSETVNLGMDFALLKNRLSGTFEYYITNTKDILLGLGLPRTSGVSGYTANIGETQNKGFELALNGIILNNVNGWTWEAGLNFYTNKNQIVALASGQERDINNGWFVGYSINSVYDYEKIGLWQEEDPHRTILEPGKDIVGSIRVKYTGEYDEDGVPVRQIGPDDRQIIELDPDFLGGFNTRVAYKGIDLSVIGAFQGGGVLLSTLNSGSSYLNLMTGRRNNIKVDYWTPENTGAKYPNPAGKISGDNPNYASTLGYFDGSYLKIRNISLGYDLSRSLLKNSGVNMRMHFTVQNPFVFFSEFNKEMGMDPETNSRGNENRATGGYSSRYLVVAFNAPSTRNYVFGVNLTF